MKFGEIHICGTSLEPDILNMLDLSHDGSRLFFQWALQNLHFDQMLIDHGYDDIPNVIFMDTRGGFYAAQFGEDRILQLAGGRVFVHLLSQVYDNLEELAALLNQVEVREPMYAYVEVSA